MAPRWVWHGNSRWACHFSSTSHLSLPLSRVKPSRGFVSIEHASRRSHPSQPRPTRPRLPGVRRAGLICPAPSQVHCPGMCHPGPSRPAHLRRRQSQTGTGPQDRCVFRDHAHVQVPPMPMLGAHAGVGPCPCVDHACQGPMLVWVHTRVWIMRVRGPCWCWSPYQCHDVVVIIIVVP